MSPVPNHRATKWQGWDLSPHSKAPMSRTLTRGGRSGLPGVSQRLGVGQGRIFRFNHAKALWESSPSYARLAVSTETHFPEAFGAALGALNGPHTPLQLGPSFLF